MVKSRDKKLDNLLEEIEVDKIGIVRLEDWKDTPLWSKVQRLLPGAKSAIVLAMEVFPEVVKHLTSKAQIGELALRDLHNRNTEMVKSHLDWEAYKTVKRLHRLGYKGIPLPADGAPYDSRFIEGVLSYKHAAQLAGLGAIGWHSMLLTPEYGARVHLACVVTNAPLPPSTPMEEYYPCPECGGACIKICPVSAIKKPESKESYNIDKYACSTYLDAAGGCSECLRVCPTGREQTS